METELTAYIAQIAGSVSIKIKIMHHDNTAKAILYQAQSHDLVMLRSVRRRTIAGLAVSDVTTEVLSKIECSLVLFGDTLWKPTEAEAIASL